MMLRIDLFDFMLRGIRLFTSRGLRKLMCAGEAASSQCLQRCTFLEAQYLAHVEICLAVQYCSDVANLRTNICSETLRT